MTRRRSAPDVRHERVKAGFVGGCWGMFPQVRTTRGPLTCTVAFARDEEAAGSNPATPTIAVVRGTSSNAVVCLTFR